MGHSNESKPGCTASGDPLVSLDTIGCDLSDKSCELCVLKVDGRIERLKSLKLTRAALVKFFGGRPKAHVVLEVGTPSAWVTELLVELGHEVTVANPRNVKLITASVSKSDMVDAELLARLGKADRTLLSPIQHRGRQARADLAVPRSRDVLVRTRTTLVNHVRSVVKSFGERLPKREPECFHAEKILALVPSDLKPSLEPVLRTIDTMNTQIVAFDRTINKSIAKRYPDVKLLHKVKGVGVLTALVFMLTLEDKGRFKKSRDVGAYVGLRPKRWQSGAKDKQLSITKCGDTFLRRLLVEAANYVIGPFGADSDLRRWGLAHAQLGGKHARARAKVAVARKLAVLLHRLWVTGEEYVPNGYAQAHTQRAA
jgi:transposase